VVVVANFTPTPHWGYRIALPGPGNWKLVANSDDRRWWGSGHHVEPVLTAHEVGWAGWNWSTEMTLAPLAITIWSNR